MDCSICFERLNSAPVMVLPCDHKFHEVCIIRWAHTSQTCPHCRAPFIFVLTPNPDPLQVVWLVAFFIYVVLFFAVMGR